MSADVRHLPHARRAVRAVAPLLLVLAAAIASPAAAQAPAGVARARAVAAVPAASPSLPAARDEAADLRFEAIHALPDTLTLADLARGVPILLQAVTLDGRPVPASVAWRIVEGDATRIAADPRTDRDGYATATLGREPMRLPRPGRLVLEARTRPDGAASDLTLRLSAVVVRD